LELTAVALSERTVSTVQTSEEAKMRTLLMHLSDLHIQGNDDPVLGRAKAIVDATKNLDYELELAVVVVSGDLAFSGEDAQYQLAGHFIQDIVSGLRN
jgi:2-keto-4-pentenoate hydratase/2-oxohepta-3-ene-1,7-dioic acid hydratase in catechol pathway